MSPKRMENLLKTENIVLNQICNNINELNREIFNLLDTTIPAIEFYQAFCRDDEGNYRMNSEYQGVFKEVVQIFDNRMKTLYQERGNKTKEIAGYVSALSQYREQSVQQIKLVSDEKEHVHMYTDITPTRQESSYITLNMPNQRQQPLLLV